MIPLEIDKLTTNVSLDNLDQDCLLMADKNSLKDLMLWRCSDIYNVTIIHAIAYYGFGLEFIDTIKNCNDFDALKETLEDLITASDDKGNNCVHVAVSQNNLDSNFFDKKIEILNKYLYNSMKTRKLQYHNY